jgi:hypothetical protein
MNKAIFSAAVLLGLTSCGANPSTPQTYSPGPNYSSTPCFDNCGGDVSCQTHCTRNTGPALPGTNLPGIAPGQWGAVPSNR